MLSIIGREHGSMEQVRRCMIVQSPATGNGYSSRDTVVMGAGQERPVRGGTRTRMDANGSAGQRSGTHDFISVL